METTITYMAGAQILAIIEAARAFSTVPLKIEIVGESGQAVLKITEGGA